MDQIIVETGEEAYTVLMEMIKIIDRYGFVSRADLYELIDMSFDYSDEKNGWRDLRSAKVVESGTMYRLELPPEIPVDINWTKRAIQHGAGIVPRVLTEQYLNAMKALGYDSVDLPYLDPERHRRNSGKVYCHRDLCIVDSDPYRFYTVHTGDCPLNLVNDPKTD